MYTTDMYEGMLAETVTMCGDGGTLINAYLARPLGPGPFPAVVLLHHMPGWDEWYREITRRFAHHGYVALSPDLYFRVGHGTPEDVAVKVRADGGIPDDVVVGDVAGAMAHLRALPFVSGKIALFGTCSGGRHAYLAACSLPDVDAVVDCWGGRVVAAKKDLDAKHPVAPIDLTADLACPILGIFGNDDRSPSADQVDIHEQTLIDAGKTYEFHRYPDAGHGFFYYHRPNYRQEQAVDGWQRIWAFLDKYL